MRHPGETNLTFDKGPTNKCLRFQMPPTRERGDATGGRATNKSNQLSVRDTRIELTPEGIWWYDMFLLLNVIY